jgi:transitional endoplasmic reticulum ATPase
MFTLERKQTIGNYIITFQIKQSDYAETYRIKDSKGKNRFLKLIKCAKLHRTQFDNEGNILEIEITKKLIHPNIVKYYDSSDIIINGQRYVYLVFDYISGETVFQFLVREASCSVYDAKNIILGILNGVKYLHTLPVPIIHNELTIQNVMLDISMGCNIPKIIDFGHACYLTQRGYSFNKNGLSLFYLAPEALNGVSSVKSDLFSVGAILYNLLFGIPPYFVDLTGCGDDEYKKRETLDTKRKLPLRIPDNKFELDENLINIIKKALAINIDDRFESADQFIRALNGEIKIEPIDSRKKTE